MAKNINSFPQIVYTYINPLFTLCDWRKLKIDLYFVKLVKGFLAKYRIHIQNLEFSELCSACSSFNALVFWTKSLNTIRFILFFSTFSLHWESSGWTAVCFKIKGDEYDTCTMYCLNSFVYFCQWNMHSCSHEYTNYTFCCFSGLGFLCIVSFYFVLASSKNNFVVFHRGGFRWCDRDS